MAIDYERWKEEQYSTENAPPKPAHSAGRQVVILLVGMTWTAIGIILLLIALVGYLVSGLFSGLAPLLGFGWMHLFCGLRTLSGTAPGTARYGILAVAFGLVWTSAAVLGAEPAMTSPTARQYPPLVVLAFGIGGVVLFLTGCLAVVYSPSYRRSREPYRRGTSVPLRIRERDRSPHPGIGPAPRFLIPGGPWLFAGVGHWRSGCSLGRYCS